MFYGKRFLKIILRCNAFFRFSDRKDVIRPSLLRDRLLQIQRTFIRFERFVGGYRRSLGGRSRSVGYLDGRIGRETIDSRIVSKYGQEGRFDIEDQVKFFYSEYRTFIFI